MQVHCHHAFLLLFSSSLYIAGGYAERYQKIFTRNQKQYWSTLHSNTEKTSSFLVGGKKSRMGTRQRVDYLFSPTARRVCVRLTVCYRSSETKTTAWR